MRYFILKQDTFLENAVRLKGFNNDKKMILLKSDEKVYNDISNVEIITDENTVYPDLLQAPVLLVSDELHKIFKRYEPTIIYKIAVLTDVDRKAQKVYRLVLPDIIDALSEDTTYNKSGWLENMVLDKEKVGEYNIFQVKAGVDVYLVASLEVVEAMLKRCYMGIKFIEVGVK